MKSGGKSKEKLNEMYYSYPDIKELQNEYLIRYGQAFLSMNNLNVGDQIEIEFSYDIVVTAYGSKQPERFVRQEMSIGVLKVDEIGRLYAESIKDFTFFNRTSNGLSGRRRKEFYKETKKKSIVTFGSGFVHFDPII